MKQCLAWDGNTIAAINDNGSYGHTRMLSVNSYNHKTFGLPKSELGSMQAMALFTTDLKVEKAFMDLLESEPLENVLRFYRNVAQAGLIGENYQLLFLAVVSSQVIAMKITRQFGSQIVRVKRDQAIAVGRDAAGAIALMAQGVNALHAVGAAHMDPMTPIDYHYAHGYSFVENLDEDVTSGLFHWVHVKTDTSACTLVPHRVIQDQHSLYSDVIRGKYERERN